MASTADGGGLVVDGCAAGVLEVGALASVMAQYVGRRNRKSSRSVFDGRFVVLFLFAVATCDGRFPSS